MKDVYVPTENFQKLQGLCEDLLRTPLGLEMGCVIGPAGRGKTSAAERIRVQSQNVVYIRYQERLTHIGIIREMAFALGGSRPRSTDACYDMILAELSRQRRIILVDEADRMSIRHLNTLRDFHDLMRVPVVLLGEEPLKTKIHQERRLMSRVAYEMRFDPVGAGDLAVFYRMALGLTLAPKHSGVLARQSDGDFRMVVNHAIQIERRMKASGMGDVTDELIREVCGENGNGSTRS